MAQDAHYKTCDMGYMGARDCARQQSCVDNAFNSPTGSLIGKPMNQETLKPVKKRKKENGKNNRNLRGNDSKEKVNFNATKGIMHSLEKLPIFFGM